MALLLAVTTTWQARADYSSTVLSFNPVAYWQLNETNFPPAGAVATNSGTLGASANGTYQPGTATLAAGPPYSGLGASNYACLFTGSGGYINCGNPAGLNISGPITIMAWIKVNAFDIGWQAIVTKGDSSWRLHRNNETGQVGFGTTALSNQDLAGSRTVEDGQWHHVVAVYDGAAKYIYVDGTLDTSVPASGTIAQDAYPVLIGENAEMAGRFFNGTMDEVAIFTYALSARPDPQDL